MNIKETYYWMPHPVQNALTSVYNYRKYRVRHGDFYWQMREELSENSNLSLAGLEDLQIRKLRDFLTHIKKHSPYYARVLESVDTANITLDEFSRNVGILTKEVLRRNLDQIRTIDPKKGVAANTGGTTGASLTVYYTREDVQARFALVDHVRSRYGYQLGKNTAWFTGKDILGKRDPGLNRYWKTDYLHRMRYYSPSHISHQTIGYYLSNLADFRPEYIIGFPSSIYEVARFGLKSGMDFPPTVKAVFTNAETMHDEFRRTITRFFGAPVYDQYGSAEGAPFFFECNQGKYHLEMQNGVFEVLDESGNPAEEGDLVVTAFYTRGTPLVRYDIGDRIGLSPEPCDCGNHNPVVEYISGRSSDYLLIEDGIRIYQSNLVNCIKGIEGISGLQAVQTGIDDINIKLEVDPEFDARTNENILRNNFQRRLGTRNRLQIDFVDHIPREKSGKVRFIINHIQETENAPGS